MLIVSFHLDFCVYQYHIKDVLWHVFKTHKGIWLTSLLVYPCHLYLSYCIQFCMCVFLLLHTVLVLSASLAQCGHFSLSLSLFQASLAVPSAGRSKSGSYPSNNKRGNNAVGEHSISLFLLFIQVSAQGCSNAFEHMDVKMKDKFQRNMLLFFTRVRLVGRTFLLL